MASLSAASSSWRPPPSPPSPLEVYSWLASGSSSASRLAVALSLVPEESWPPGARNHKELTNAISNLAKGPMPGESEPVSTDRRDPREYQDTIYQNPMRVFTDNEEVKIVLAKSSRFQLVEAGEPHDVLFTISNITNFLELPPERLVNSFPFEGGLVQKDLLPQTVRRACYSADRVAPTWWNPCFDLSTEAHFFLAEYHRREASGEPNTWIVKAAQGSHAINYTVTKDARVVIERMRARPRGADQVAQLYVERPFTLQSRKFDLRFYVLVRSFAPFEAFIHPHYYARLAADPWGKGDELDSRNKHFTTSLEKGAGDFPHMWPEQMAQAVVSDGLISLAEWEKAIAAAEQTLGQLFTSVAPLIGEWPRSRAYYGVDLMFESLEVDGRLSLTPKLLEVNFQADFDVARYGGTDGLEVTEEGDALMEKLINDFFETLFTDTVAKGMKAINPALFAT